MLPFFSPLFYAAVKFRNWLYDKRWLKVHKVTGTFIVSIGNLAVGGTGKTPLVIALLEIFKQKPLALLTRGYRGKVKKEELPFVVESTSSPEKVGDEPFLIKQNVKEALVVVDPDRVRGANFAKRLGRTLLFLDDGMQHRRIARQLEVVVVDGENPFGNGLLLPGGILREPKEHLKRADYVAVMGGDFKPDQPFFRVKRKLLGVFDIKTGEKISITGKKVALFCGVGNPAQVEKTVEEGGGEVIHRWFLRDHTKPSFEKLHDFATLCENGGASVLLCTEKDKVKLPSSLSLAIPVAFLKIQLEVIEGLDQWQELLDRIDQEIG